MLDMEKTIFLQSAKEIIQKTTQDAKEPRSPKNEEPRRSDKRKRAEPRSKDDAEHQLEEALGEPPSSTATSPTRILVNPAKPTIKVNPKSLLYT